MISPSADYRNSQCPVASLLNPSRQCVTYVMAKVLINKFAGQQRGLIADDLSCCLSRPDGGAGRRSGTRLIIGSRSLPSVAVPSSRSCLAADLRFRWNGAWCSGSAMLSAVVGVDGPRGDVAPVHCRVHRDQVARGDGVVDVVVQAGERGAQPQRGRVEAG